MTKAAWVPFSKENSITIGKCQSFVLRQVYEFIHLLCPPRLTVDRRSSKLSPKKEKPLPNAVMEGPESNKLMNNFSEKVNFIWSVADLIRDTFKRSKYQDVILPLTVLRRIDCVLQPTKEHVLEVNTRLKGKLENLAPQLCKASGFSFFSEVP